MTILDEMGEQTLKYRAERLGLWKHIQKRRDEYIASARQHGASDEAAHIAAARHMRGEVRVFIDDLLLHLREQHAGAFLKQAPREWGVRTELLLDVDPLVPSFIGQSYPVVAWTGAIDAAEKEVIALARAERDADWTPWLMRRMERVGAVGEEALGHVFGAVGAIGQGFGSGVGEVGKGVGEAIGGVGKGVGDGVGNLGKGIGDALKIGAAIIGVGAVVIGGIWVLRR
jgi:hypothetical protein